jgi:hypothetical protein
MTTKEQRLEKMRNRQTKEQKFGMKQAYKIPDNVPRYQMKEGENRLDIIMYRITNPENPAVTVNGMKVGELDYFQQLEVHNNIGINKNRYLCMKRMFGKPCAVCEAQNELYEQNDRDGAKKLYPQTRAVYNVIDLDSPEKGIQVWEISHYWVETELRKLAAMKSKKGPMILFGDYEIGKTIVFYASKDPIYGLKPANFSFEDREPYQESVCDKAYPLDQYYVMADYDEVQADYLQIDDGNASNHEEEEEPVTEPKKTFEQVAKEEDEFFKANKIEDIVSPPQTEPPKRERRRREPEEGNVCPMSHVFGTDFDAHENCSQCEDKIYEKCGDMFDKMNP